MSGRHEGSRHLARTPTGPAPPPPVQRLRLRYAKRGRLRFSSHRDFQRAVERAVRRAGVPIAYSAGFSPHPKISYANAAPTGAASEAEYLEMALTTRCDPEQVRSGIDRALPDGLDLVEAVEVRPGSGSLADRLQASSWRVEFDGAEPAVVGSAVAALLDAGTVEVQRLTTSGTRTVDVGSALVRAEVTPGPASSVGGPVPMTCAILNMVVRHTTPVARPDDVLAALRVVADLAPPSPPVVTRLAQGPLDEADGSVADPLAPDRDGVGA